MTDILYIGAPYYIGLTPDDEEFDITAEEIMPVLYDKPSKKKFIGSVKRLDDGIYECHWDTSNMVPTVYTLEIYYIEKGAAIRRTDDSYIVRNIESATIKAVFDDGYIEDFCKAVVVSVS